MIGKNSTNPHLTIINSFQPATPYKNPISSDTHHTIERKNHKNIL